METTKQHLLPLPGKNKLSKPKKKSRNRAAKSTGRQIVPGISLSKTNEATVAPELGDLIFDLALKLEDATGLPVDVQHVIAAIVMGSQTGEIDSQTPLNLTDEQLLQTTEKYVRVLFQNLDGKIEADD